MLGLSVYATNTSAVLVSVDFAGVQVNVAGEFINAVPVPQLQQEFAPLFQNAQTTSGSIAFDTNQLDIDPDPNTGTYGSGMLSASIPELGLSVSGSTGQISSFNDVPNVPPDDQFFAAIFGEPESFSSNVGLPDPTFSSIFLFGDTSMLADDQLPMGDLDWTFGNLSFNFTASDGTTRQVLTTFVPAPAPVPTIFTSGDVDPVISAATDVDLGTMEVIIGITSNGSLTVGGGDTLSAGKLTVGQSVGSNGQVSVTDGSTVQLDAGAGASTTVIGNAGDGSLTIDEGEVHNAPDGTVLVGMNPNGSGLVEVLGTSQFDVGNLLRVGENGTVSTGTGAVVSGNHLECTTNASVGGSGTYEFDTITGGFCRWTIGRSPGQLVLDADLNSVGDTFDFEVLGASPGVFEFDQLVVTGFANIVDAILNITFEGLLPQASDTFDFFTLGDPGNSLFDFAEVNLIGAMGDFELVFEGDRVVLVASNDFIATTPEPTSLALLALGLAGLGVARRHRAYWGQFPARRKPAAIAADSS